MWVSGFVVFFCLLRSICAAADVAECKVCADFISSVIADLPEDIKYSAPKIKEAIEKKCEGTTGVQNRFCYRIGALETSATKDIMALVGPLSRYKPPQEACADAAKTMGDLCKLKDGSAVDLANFNFRKAKISELRDILYSWSIYDCVGCVEKSDYINLIMEKMPSFAPEAYKAIKERKQSEL